MRRVTQSVGSMSFSLFRKTIWRKEPHHFKCCLPNFLNGDWKWTLEELQCRLKDTQVTTTALLPSETKGGVVNWVSQWKSRKTDLPISTALRLVRHYGRLQCRLDPSLFWQAQEQLPEPLAASQIDIVFDNSFVWVTSGGLRTSLHSDESDGFLLHLSGKKLCLLISPSCSDKDPKLLQDLLRYRSARGSIEELYFSQGGAIQGVKPLVAELSPGDMLYIPKRWLHDIESLHFPTVSIATRFQLSTPV